MHGHTTYLKPYHAVMAIVATLGFALPWWRVETYGSAVRRGRAPPSPMLWICIALPILGTIVLERLLERAGSARPSTTRFAAAVIVMVEVLWLIPFMVVAGFFAVSALTGNWYDARTLATMLEIRNHVADAIPYALLAAALCSAGVVRMECAWRGLETEFTTTCDNSALQLTAVTAGAAVAFEVINTNHALSMVTALAIVAIGLVYTDAVRSESLPPAALHTILRPSFIVYAVSVQAWAFTALILFMAAVGLTTWITFQPELDEFNPGKDSRVYQVGIREPDAATASTGIQHVDVNIIPGPEPKTYAVQFAFNLTRNAPGKMQIILRDDLNEEPTCSLMSFDVPVHYWKNYLDQQGYEAIFAVGWEAIAKPTQHALTCHFPYRRDFARSASFSGRSLQVRAIAMHGASLGPPSARDWLQLSLTADFRAFRPGEPIVVSGGRFAGDDRQRELRVPELGWTEDQDSIVMVRWEDPGYVQQRDSLLIIIGALYALMAAALLEWIRPPFNAVTARE